MKAHLLPINMRANKRGELGNSGTISINSESEYFHLLICVGKGTELRVNEMNLKRTVTMSESWISERK